MRFVVDVCLSREVAEELQKLEFTAIHWSEIGRSNDKDSTIMQWCAANECSLITADLDFGALLRHATATRPSVIILRTSVHSADHVVPILRSIITDLSREIELGALISADDEYARIRILPIE